MTLTNKKRQFAKLIGAHIAQIRKRRGWTQYRLAKELDVHPVNYNRYERGVVSIPFETLAQICKLLSVSADYILGTKTGDNPVQDMVYLGQYPGIIGAAIGDIYGSYYEFLTGPKTPKEEVRLHHSSKFTDDTVLTAAIADYLTRKKAGENVTPAKVVQQWARRYPDAGYGTRFHYQWLYETDPKPYGSLGNGAAMRISAVPYFASSIEECKALSREVTEITHNHPEGIRGAETIAVATYMALHGASKVEIEAYARKMGWNIDLDYEELMAHRDHGEETCRVTVPQAIWVFLHSESFEDCLRLAISIRWDADTLAAIACTIAEAYYKEIPAEIYYPARDRLDSAIKTALAAVPTMR